MMNQKRGLTETISCPAMEIPGRQTTSLNIWSKRKTQVERRRAKQQTIKKLRPQPIETRNIFKKDIVED